MSLNESVIFPQARRAVLSIAPRAIYIFSAIGAACSGGGQDEAGADKLLHNPGPIKTRFQIGRVGISKIQRTAKRSVGQDQGPIGEIG